ncbi:MAG: elongation factor P [Candidatus Paceibacterota bacterium]
MLNFSDLKKGTEFVKDGQPFVVLDYLHVKKQRGAPVAQLKIKNLITSKTQDVTAHQSDKFEEAVINKISVEFVYEHRGSFNFKDPKNPSNRFDIDEEVIGDNKNYLKEGVEVKAVKFNGEIVNIELPVKVDLKVTEAPPSIKGSTADGGTKVVTTETGLKVNAPLFIEQGDVIRVNTEKNEYVERVKNS